MFTKPTLVPSPKVVLPSKTEGYPKPSGNEGVPKQTFGSQNFVQNVRFASLRRQTFGLQALQSKAPFCKPYKASFADGGKTTFCKPYKAKLCKLCTSFAKLRVPKQTFGSQIFGYQSKPLDRKPKGTKANLWIAKLLDKESTPLI